MLRSASRRSRSTSAATSNAPAAPAIENWNFYLAYNLFRIAAILQGVYKRATEGLASSDNAKQASENAKALAELGWRYAQRA